MHVYIVSHGWKVLKESEESRPDPKLSILLAKAG